MPARLPSTRADRPPVLRFLLLFTGLLALALGLAALSSAGEVGTAAGEAAHRQARSEAGAADPATPRTGAPRRDHAN
jgi:hypothetical protein